MAMDTTRRRLIGGVAGSIVLASRFGQASSLTYQPLFHIARNKNANIVQYDAAVVATDKLDAQAPVVCYWVNLATNGGREGLSSLERRAYGFQVKPEGGGSWLLYLNATRNRSIRVVFWQGRWVAQVLIGKRSAVLTRIYVFADESAVIPQVRWIELFGLDMITSAQLNERLKP